MAPLLLWTVLTHPLLPAPIEIPLALSFVFQSRTFHERPKFHSQGGLDGAWELLRFLPPQHILEGYLSQGAQRMGWGSRIFS